MKTIIRAFVVALAVTGAIATTSANGSSVQTPTVIARTSAMQPQGPVANCDPNNPASVIGCTNGGW